MQRPGVPGFVEKLTCEAKEAPRPVSEISPLGVAHVIRVGS